MKINTLSLIVNFMPWFYNIIILFLECGKWTLSADVTSLLAGSLTAKPGKLGHFFKKYLFYQFKNWNCDNSMSDSWMVSKIW